MAAQFINHHQHWRPKNGLPQTWSMQSIGPVDKKKDGNESAEERIIWWCVQVRSLKRPDDWIALEEKLLHTPTGILSLINWSMQKEWAHENEYFVHPSGHKICSKYCMVAHLLKFLLNEVVVFSIQVLLRLRLSVENKRQVHTHGIYRYVCGNQHMHWPLDFIAHNNRHNTRTLTLVHAHAAHNHRTSLVTRYFKMCQTIELSHF